MNDGGVCRAAPGFAGSANDTGYKRGVKKHNFYPYFVDKGFIPPPIIHAGRFYNNIIKY